MTLKERVRRPEDEREILHLNDVGPYGRTDDPDAIAATIDSYTPIPFALHLLANTHAELDDDHATATRNLVMVTTGDASHLDVRAS